jgi:16S rRNA (uracil1498-N3)-methyltransferase
MLTLAEKAVELGASAWRSVIYRRSLSVTPRGEGAAFHDKLRARMISALEQSGGAWLPELLDEESMRPELAAARDSHRVLLDGAGVPAADHAWRAPLVIALGPEGGLDEQERASFHRAGWQSLSLGANVLRFETAGIVALGLARTRLR